MSSILKFEKSENEKRSNETSKVFHFHKTLILTFALRQSKLKFLIKNSKTRKSIFAFLLFEELF